MKHAACPAWTAASAKHCQMCLTYPWRSQQNDIGSLVHKPQRAQFADLPLIEGMPS
jgi:hypothetical protein